MLSHYEFPCGVQGIRDWLNARHKKIVHLKISSRLKAFAPRIPYYPQGTCGNSFKNEINASVKTENS